MAGKKKQGFEGVLGGIAEVLEKLGELAEKGEQLKKSGTFESSNEGVNGVYGFSVKFGNGRKSRSGPKVEPFGNVRKTKSGKSYFDEVREPLTDVLEEEDYTLIIIEMPGIAEHDVQLDTRELSVTVSAERGEKKFRKEITLSRPCKFNEISMTSNNGIIEVRCPH